MDKAYPHTIGERLERIAKVLFLNADYINNNGLLKGKMGVAIFFYNYACYSHNEMYKKQADSLLKEIFAQLTPTIPLDYENGLNGIGVGLNYLLLNKFIDASCYRILKDLDIRMGSVLNNQKPNVKTLQELLGYGKYFLGRLNHWKGPEMSGEYFQYRELLFTIVDLMDRPFNTYQDLFDAIEFLSYITTISGTNQKPTDYLNHAVDKLETMLNEDVHFNVYPASFNPLVGAKVLLSASEIAQNNEYSAKALTILKLYEEGFSNYLNNKTHSLKEGMFKWALLYEYIFQKLKEPTYGSKAKKWFDASLHEDKEALTGFVVGANNQIPELGIGDGYAGIGMALMSCATKKMSDWQYLIPN